MNYEFLTNLQQAVSDEEKSWILTEIYLKVLPPDVAEAALAAAVPHWFNAPILAALLQTDTANAERLYQELQKLSFVEPFGELGHNVHDLTRAGVLRHYFIKEHLEFFKSYSQRIYDYFKPSEDSQYIVEALHHLLVIDPIEGMKLFVARMKAYRKDRNYSAANNLLRNAQELVNLSVLQGADEIEVEQQAYYFARALSKSDELEDLKRAAKMFRPDEDVSRYQDADQLRELVKRSKRDFLTQKLDEARQIGDSSRTKNWLSELGDISRLEDKDYETALQRYTDALTIDPNNQDALTRRGAAFLMIEKYATAVADLTCAIELDPDSVFAFALRGAAYQQIGEYEMAISDLNRAIEIDPQYTWALVRRGAVYRRMRQYDIAIADLTRAIELDPKYAGAFARRGEIYRKMEQYTMSIMDLTRALELDPNYAWALASRGKAYQQMGQHEAAVKDLSRAIELDPDHDWNYYRRGLTCLAMKQTEQAQSDFAEAIHRAALEYEQKSDDWRIGFNLAIYHLAAGNLTEAERLYQMGLSAAPRDKVRGAIDDLTNFLRLFPEHPQAQAFRARLQEHDRNCVDSKL